MDRGWKTRIVDGTKYERALEGKGKVTDSLMPGLLPNGANHGNVTFSLSLSRCDSFACASFPSPPSLVVIVIVIVMAMEPLCYHFCSLPGIRPNPRCTSSWSHDDPPDDTPNNKDTLTEREHILWAGLGGETERERERERENLIERATQKTAMGETAKPMDNQRFESWFSLNQDERQGLSLSHMAKNE
ncbi:hypothetical protein ASPBRDRAFT_443779 [Aspergillus brasiliensis CBS 101740]|uniref:Uncharacterized protein n=1 Tax=Aspergillus brasiliensis (strain CBS 101740 / IMI 381727 / IBT 21946) TaxID=767769 RepID=A0A1L9URX7_ASPBC|nr:hypothetical protein ASPBRDRAFT_443779 [Aspergillus brasiliensis CBS 101740]